MADVTVSQLAEQVKTTPEKLLEQLKSAGVCIESVEDTITPEQKRQLLMYLRTSKNQTNETKKTITLKRKTKTVVKQGKVNVEFRSKKTFKPVFEEAEEEPVSDAASQDDEATTDAKPEDQSLDTSQIINDQEQDTKTETVNTEPETAAHTAELDISGISDNEARTAPQTKNNNQTKTTELHLSKQKRQPTKKRQANKSTSYSNEKASKKLTQGFAKPASPVVREINIPETITVAELAQRMSVKGVELIKTMMNMGAMATINQVIDQETAALVVEEMGHTVKLLNENELEENLLAEIVNGEYEEKSRAPVVTIMGHVDHGKTSLLDYIRRTKVTSTEAGGITQHIGAYHVETEQGMITFLDTPGHAAFTAMRARGAKCTDIVILVVSADDGAMPQTIEAVQHARAAEVPIIVAVNKIDKPEADPERVRSELSQHNVISEDWGGDTIFQNISAKTGEGIDDLLGSILLQAEMLELKAINEGAARGVVLESRLDKGRGPVASILITQGRLNKGDILLAGREFGRIRQMIGDDGKPTTATGPSMPVEILGLSGTPTAGDEVIVLPNERKARELALFRQGKYRAVRLAKQRQTSLENIFDQLGQDEKNTLNIVLKADVQGSVEAISDALQKLSTNEVGVNLVAVGIGGITESDANLALASNAIILGFNVRADASARQLIRRESIDLHYYNVIYHLIDEVKAALSGLLKPTEEEKIVGLAQVRDVFRSSKLGAIAGCMVLEGLVKKSLPIRVLRDNVVIYEGALESLRRYKDDVNEVRHGTECGIGVKNYNDIKTGDQIEVYEKVIIQRKL